MPAIALGALAVGSAVAGGIASHNAAGAIQDATKNANNTQLAFNAKNNAALAPFTNFGKNSADKLAFLLGEKSPSADTSSTESQLSGMTSKQALQTAQTMGSDRVSPSREVTQSWIDQGIPFHTINGIAVKDAPAPTASSSTNDPNAPGFGSLLKPMDATTFQADPGYQFRLDQGNQAIARAAAAKGATYSGGTLKAIDNFNSGTAAQEFAAANSRYDTNRQLTYNFLMGPTALGANETNTGVNANENTAATINNNTLAGGQAQAAGDLGVGSAISNGLNGIGGSIIYSQLPGTAQQGGTTGGSSSSSQPTSSTLADLFRVPNFPSASGAINNSKNREYGPKN